MMKDPNLAPIAFFVYNRPDLTLQTLQHLSRNAEAAESVLFIFCDGPRSGAAESERLRIQQVHEVIGQQQWCKEVQIIKSDKNNGLANSIIRGVTKVVKEYGKVIVLEDDLSVSPYFLRYMNDALTMYEDEEKVLAIHGYLYPVKSLPGVTESSFFIRDPSCWGWATWQRSWSLFEPDTAKLYDLIRLKGLRQAFTFWGGYPYMRMLRQQMAGKVDSWAVRWRAVAYLHDKYTLYPVKSLVRHDGNVPEATHYHVGKNDTLYTDISEEPVELQKIPVVNNEEVEREFGRFLKKHSGMSIGSKIKNRLGKIFAKNK